MGFWSLCSKKDGNPFCKSIYLFCSNQLCVCQESVALIRSQEAYTLLGRWVCSGPVFAQSRSPQSVTGCRKATSLD